MKKFRIIAVFFSVLIFVIFTYIHSHPRVAFEESVATFFNQKTNWGTEKYPHSLNEIHKLNTYSYKWALVFFYTFFNILATYLLIFGLFANKKHAITMLYVYMFLFGMIAFFLIIGLATHRFDIGFGVVQYLKRFMQSIYPAMFFVIYFLKFDTKN